MRIQKILTAAALMPALTQAAVTITWTQVGDKFHGDLSGSITPAELAASGNGAGYHLYVASGGSFDTTPSFSTIMVGQSLIDVYFYDFTKVSVGSANANFAAYTNLDGSANDVTGTNSFGFYVDGTGAYLYLPLFYYLTPGELTSTIVTDRRGMNLSQAFKFGTVISLDGSALITYANGTPAVPEPSTYGLALGGLAIAGAVVRRRRSK